MASIETLADRMLKEAVRNRASDIHIIPRQKDTLIQLRIANKLIPRFILPLNECDRLISHFKFKAQMDIGEKRRPQSGAFSLRIDGQYVGARLSTLPSNNHESLVIRILPQQEQIPYTRLSLFPSMTKKLLALLKHAHGLVIFTGPTGSGKTTTLYSLLNETSHMFNRNVITLEDPIERNYDSVLQVQVNEKAGVTYSTGLKAILRHDPDIIMVGEIRDSETARIAVRAALTGHLVLSTMHTRDAKGAIYRLLEFGVNRLEIEQTLVAVTAQRLVELTCSYCGENCSPFCDMYGPLKRASVFELLSGRALACALKEASGEKSNFHYQTLKGVIRKGVALGFIKESEYHRWVFEEEKE
ncbi:competence type IV pilus ATPase ComGA [Bacillus massilinigeriensis]|uniref:competence type IV pilus ATPase ComGA n=1 Tax=Bacillus massilionigeriensis TaxID=1805475 RepID=UPI00096AF4DF|nr:competence type IV pilus ATPase ComGA [Bacillus massilionigeriensis]